MVFVTLVLYTLSCYCFLQERVCSVQQNERNYHIFYQMLAGLGPEEKGTITSQSAKFLIHVR